jgi:hypothetical protein
MVDSINNGAVSTLLRAQAVGATPAVSGAPAIVSTPSTNGRSGSSPAPAFKIVGIAKGQQTARDDLPRGSLVDILV